MKTLSLTGLLLLVIMGMSTNLTAKTTINYADGTGIVVVVSGLTASDISQYFEVPSDTSLPPIQASVYDDRGKLMLQQTVDCCEIQFSNVTLKPGFYTLVIEVGEESRLIDFQI